MNHNSIKPPKIAEWLLYHTLDNRDRDFILGDFAEFYDEIKHESGLLKAQMWYWLQSLKSIPYFINNFLYWKIAMFKNYFKIVVRNFNRYKMYSFINVFGLAIGIAACLMIYLWVQDELSYDRFHSDADKIYRIERKFDFNNLHGQVATTSAPYGAALVRDYPEIENFVRFNKADLSIKDHRNIFRRQQLLFTDNSIFDVFDFRLHKGDPKTALIQPRSVVLSRENALKYLGTDDVIDKILTIEWNGQPDDFRITGILKEV